MNSNRDKMLIFNKQFDEFVQKEIERAVNIEKEKLNIINDFYLKNRIINDHKLFYNMTVIEFLNEWYNSLFKNSEHKIFFIGLTLIIIPLIINIFI